ncbi:hypothetical protein CspeluHIS016_0902550 [Cutaneotrichosporon spelunceum]|uniref:Uncharacterized protein n=1 Tax=Cutaneotrichosporon spelunceum TaxID=1672016 RepID=A0AAD3YFC2_9TREE|nr:hypothetical protein CspeluHIS016_0902550 [Cutaneotrichosporon spelunceum]
MSGSTVTTRRVRTVPPSARLDPPTPTGESHPTFDTARIENPKQRKRRFRSYWSSTDDSDSDDESSSDDDEPPWWTFTQNGVAKLRSRWNEQPISPPATGSVSETHDDSVASGAESGRDSGRATAKTRRRLPFATPPRQNSAGSSTSTRAREAASRIFHPRPLRQTWMRGSTDIVEPPQAEDIDSRSTSAPDPEELPNNKDVTLNSPQLNDDAGDHNAIDHGACHETDTPRASMTGRPKPKRFLSMPQRRSQDDAALTDSETITLSRMRAKQRLWPALHRPLTEEDGNEVAAESDTAAEAAVRPRHRRINTQNLRLRIPANVSEHFAGGWPHAGSWQHALHYGLMDEDEKPRRHSMEPPNVDRHRDNGGNALVEEPDNISPQDGSTHADEGANGPVSAHGHSESVHRRHVVGHVHTSSVHSRSSVHGHGHGHGLRTSMNDADSSTSKPRTKLHLDLSNLDAPPRAQRKSRSRRTRRYRPALMPPTPRAHVLSFNQSRTVIENWGDNARPTPDPDTNPFDRVNPFDRIDEECPYSDDARSEKVGMFGRRRSVRPLDRLDRRNRLRRMLFLDARVTIYIRFFNLGIAVTLLALSVTIRQKIDQLGLSGVIGPSTTLIIAYSSLTIVHVLTAMYREYYGRPIGLWGLRSKMLWVCLDLLFIALWSSGATLAINDYINTPLDCTPLMPWWSHGIEYTNTPSTSLLSFAVFESTVPVSESAKLSDVARSVCRRQAGCFAVALVALLLYCGNMVLALFRIFETVRRTANPIRTVSV